MPSSVKELLAAANSSVPTISPQDAKALIESGKALAVDVRDGTEVQASGKVQGAKHVSRGMLEFRADPESPYYDNTFDKDKTVIVYCASGGRSAFPYHSWHPTNEMCAELYAPDLGGCLNGIAVIYWCRT